MHLPAEARQMKRKEQEGTAGKEKKQMSFQIAIDGPAGAGKRTIARMVAKEKGFIYVDTGAMYRAMAYYLLCKGVAMEDEDAIGRECAGARISIRYEKGEQIVLLNGENVNGVIRTEEVSKMSSMSSKHPKVRQRLTQLQKELAGTSDVVMDGRDIGTCVLPDADVKIYLTASVEVRANRRYEEQKQKGIECDLEQIAEDIAKRDEQDMNREIAPLKQAEDAIMVDSSYMTIKEVSDKILDLCKDI